MIKKFLLGMALVLFMTVSAGAVTFSVGPNYYHGFSHSDFYHRTYVRPGYVVPNYRNRCYRSQYVPPYVNPYYNPVIPYHTVPTSPRGYHFQLRVR